MEIILEFSEWAAHRHNLSYLGEIDLLLYHHLTKLKYQYQTDKSDPVEISSQNSSTRTFDFKHFRCHQ